MNGYLWGMWTMIFLFGSFLLIRGFYFFLRGLFLVLKCLFIYLFASEDYVQKSFEKVLKKECADYRAFENELEEIIEN